ncbi:MAG TPA: hypothetical protein PL040_06920 [Bacteroidales bacterium]|nr:hypothetical protein [Bacteroidales bacterium]
MRRRRQATGGRQQAEGRRQKENQETVRRNKPPLYEVERGLGVST